MLAMILTDTKDLEDEQITKAEGMAETSTFTELAQEERTPAPLLFNQSSWIHIP